MASSVKKSHNLPPRKSESSRISENSNPNLLMSTPRRKSVVTYESTSQKSVKSLKSLIAPSPLQDNKFIVRKKLALKNSKASGSKIQSKASASKNQSKAPVLEPNALLDRFMKKIQIRAPISSPIDQDRSEDYQIRKSKLNYSISNKNRDLKPKNLEHTLTDAPEPGEGRVMYLVKAFEKLCMSNEEDPYGGEKRGFKFILSEIENLKNKADETEISYSGGSTSSERRTIGKFEMDSGEQSSIKSTRKRNSNISNRIKRDSTGSSQSGRSFTKKAKVTNPLPFTLKTEERGRAKEENFQQKKKELLLEEERLRVPVALGLPWTTDEPEYPMKPQIKEPTEPLDLILHTDIRAMERAEFDHQVAQKMNFIDQLKLERERQIKMEEEEEIKRSRKESVPRAHPMPCFDKPFMPKKSVTRNTVPKEPKFHARPPRHDKS